MRTLATAARLYAGYKLKALSLLVFITVGLGFIMFGVDLIYNSFNLFFDKPATYFLPRYFVAAKPDFDILKGDFAVADLALKEGKRQALAKALGRRFELMDVAYFYALLQSRSDPNKRIGALVIALDFDSIGEAYPYFKGRLSAEDVAAYKERPRIMAEAWIGKRASMRPGEQYTLLSTDYFKDYNGIKVELREIAKSPMREGDSILLPVVYIDLSHVKRLLAMPAGIAFPCLVLPRRPAHALSFEDSSDMAAIKAAAGPLGLSAFSVSTVSEQLYKTYTLYRGVLILLSILLVVLMMAAISANLAINFQNRRADFGLMKAFGCSDARLLALLLAENALGLALPTVLAFGLNLLAGWIVPPFKVIGNFTLLPNASAPGFAIVLASALLIWAASSIQPYRYLKRIEPVAIMREE
jgi:ABC-type lipoprotein release transport system permease subunit